MLMRETLQSQNKCQMEIATRTWNGHSQQGTARFRMILRLLMSLKNRLDFGLPGRF